MNIPARKLTKGGVQIIDDDNAKTCAILESALREDRVDQLMDLLHLLLLLLLLQPVVVSSTASSSESEPDPWIDPSVLLPPACNNITYPFGIPDLTGPFGVFCNQGGNMTIQLGTANVTVLELSLVQGYVRVSLGAIAWRCGRSASGLGPPQGQTGLSLVNTPYTFNNTRNKFTVISCDALVLIRNSSSTAPKSGCASYCTSNGTGGIIDGSCSGVGCCQAAIPMGLKKLDLDFSSIRNLTGSRVVVRQTCSRAYVLEQERFVFSAGDLYSETDRARSVVLDWAIGNKTCVAAKRDNAATFACKENSYCYDSPAGGYRCNCTTGYAGNPYMVDGCQDIDECDELLENLCVHKCNNEPGGFYCSCPTGASGDGRIDGSGCKRAQLLEISLVTVLGILILVLIGLICSYWFYERRKAKNLKEKCFLRNGGLLLQQHISARQAIARIFSTKELEMATENFNEARVVGRGGNGTVYKGILLDQRVVAIKKAKVVDETQIEQFINEVVILSQIGHNNVVKLLGCCLETQVPLLVYEFISNGTLFHHLHTSSHTSSMSWENRLRIAVETSWAIAYLHSLPAIPIIHRDIKSTNILLDENLTAKVSDFGASRLVPLDHTHVTTLVQGTIGYLDPEYFHTSQLTEKSDVYSFGVVLVELLTRKKPVSIYRSESERNLASHFVSSMEKNNVVELIDQQVVEAGTRHLSVVAELAKRCLSLKGEERPKMKEVLVELNALRRLLKQHSANQREERDSSLATPPNPRSDDEIKGCEMASNVPSDTSGIDSMENHLLSSMDLPR